MRSNFYKLLGLILFISSATFAQERMVSGIVTDDTGLVLPGVNILIKNTNKGTQSDFDGKYSIMAKPNEILVYSYVGFTTQEVNIGDRDTINVSLDVNAAILGEVVINALGVQVKRADKTASISKVKGEAISNSGEIGVIQGLSAKAAGVNITNSSGDPGASAYIQIRGQSSITRSLQPLFVVDGIPINNDEIGNGVAGTSQQSRVNDLNPNDIQSIKVLKGASASALWGSRAANGVILVTTKSGSKNGGGKIDVNVFSNVSFDQNLRRLPLQSTFGKGNNGIWSGSGAGSQSGSWGDRILSRAGGDDEFDATGEFFQSNNGNIYYPVTTKNSISNFNESNYDSVFKTGTYLETGLGISGGNKDGSFYLSLGKLDQQGMIRESEYIRYNARFNANLNISDKLTFKGNLAYTNTNSNRIQTGSNLSGLLLGLYRTPADFDNRDFIGTHFNADGTPYQNSHRAYRQQNGTNAGDRNPTYNNPLWTLKRQRNPNEVDRYIASGQLNYSLNDWFSIIGIGGIDNYSDTRNSFFPVNSAANGGNGTYNESTINYSSYYSTIFGQAFTQLTDDISAEFTLGYNFTQRKTRQVTGSYQNFILDTDQITFSNATAENVTSTTDFSQIRTSAGFGQANFDYNNLLFLNLTGRAENASSFGGNKTFFYPSVGLGFTFTELGNLNNNKFLSSGKLRLSYGQTGQEPIAYATDTYYASAVGGEGFGPAYDAGGYDGSIVRSATLGNKNLEPEIKTEYEVGFDFKFLDNRISLTTNFYKNETDGALFFSTRPASTGFTTQYGNFGNIENTGFELELGLDIIKNDDFSWSINGTWNTYKNEVTNIDGAESLFLGGFAGASSRAVVGEALGTLWGVSYNRDDNNNLILDGNGFPTVAPQEGVLGDPNPDWRGGIGSSINYKGFSLTGLLDASIGGDVWDGTSGALSFFGRTIETAQEVTLSAADAASIVNINGVSAANSGTAVTNTDGSVTVRGNLQDFGGGNVLLDQSWYQGIGGGFGPVSENFIKDATWVKLRQVSLGYFFSPKLFEKVFINSIDVTLTGRNLWLWTKDDLGFDPESNLTGASNARGLQYFNHPTSKSFLASIKINF